MGVCFVSQKQDDFHITIWSWSYFLGLFEKTKIIPKNILKQMQGTSEGIAKVDGDTAKKLAEGMREYLRKHMEKYNRLDNIPVSNSKSATFAYKFVSFLQNKKGYPNESIRASGVNPDPKLLMAFISWCYHSDGFEVM